MAVHETKSSFWTSLENVFEESNEEERHRDIIAKVKNKTKKWRTVSGTFHNIIFNNISSDM